MTVEHSRRLAAVWFADVVGYTDLSSKDEDAALRLVAVLQEVAQREVSKQSGRVVKYVGDAVLATFESAGGAIRAALALRDGFLAADVARNIGASVRVGLHVGEIHTAADGDVYGDGVNAAARVQGAAAPGQVLLSALAYESVRHRPEFRAQLVGRKRLKGLSRPMDLYAISLAGPGEETDVGAAKQAVVSYRPAPHYGRAIAVGLVAGMVGLVSLGIFLGGGPIQVGPGSGTLDTGGPGSVDVYPGEVVVDSEEAEGRLSVGVEAYYAGDYPAAIQALNPFLTQGGTWEQRRRGLRYLARTLYDAGRPEHAQSVLYRLLSTEPPLALLIPSLESEGLMTEYYAARRGKMVMGGDRAPTRPVRGIMVFDLQVRTRGDAGEGTGVPLDIGYVVAFMLQTDLMEAGLPALSVEEMTFGDRGDQAYVDLEQSLGSVSGGGPTHLLTGSVTFAQGEVLLTAWVHELDTGGLVLTRQVTGPMGELLDLPSELAGELAVGLGEVGSRP